MVEESDAVGLRMWDESRGEYLDVGWAHKRHQKEYQRGTASQAD
jgi:hypothetical protein